MSHPHGKPALPYCRNCHFTLATPRPVFCGHCGQETDLHPPSVREMFTEYLGHYVAFDGPLWRTLWALICLPGYLTNAYFHGQRRRYVLPLRVYLSASFVFFVGSHLLPHTTAADSNAEATEAAPVVEPGKPVRLRVKPGATPNETAAEAEALAKAQAASAAASRPPRGKQTVITKLGDCDEAQPQNCTRLERWGTRLIKNAGSMNNEQWTARIVALAPYGMLAMQPVFAALLLAMFAGTGRRYAEHFVFSLHSHSLWFLALLMAFATDLTPLLILAVFGHGVMALRRVYGVSRAGALWRGLLLSLGYFLLLMLGLIVLVAAIAATIQVKTP